MSKEFEYTDDYFLDRGYKKYNKTERDCQVFYDFVFEQKFRLFIPD